MNWVNYLSRLYCIEFFDSVASFEKLGIYLA